MHSGINQTNLIETKVDPLLKNLHNDQRFAALLKKLNMPPDSAQSERDLLHTEPIKSASASQSTGFLKKPIAPFSR